MRDWWDALRVRWHVVGKRGNRGIGGIVVALLETVEGVVQSEDSDMYM